MSSASPGLGRGAQAAILLVVFIDLLGFGLLIPLTVNYAKSFGIGEWAAVQVSTVFSLGQLFGAIIWGRLSDRYGRKPILMISISLSLLAYVLLFFASPDLLGSLVLLFAARFLGGFAAGNLTVAQAYIADVTTPKQRTRALGLVGMAFGLGFVLGPALTGATVSIWTELPIVIATGLVLLNLILVGVLVKESLPQSLRRLGDGSALRAVGQRLRRLPAAVLRPVVGHFMILYFGTTLALGMMETPFPLFVNTEWVSESDVDSRIQELASEGAEPESRAEVRSDLATQISGQFLFYIGLILAFMQGVGLRVALRYAGERTLLLVGYFLAPLGLVGLAFTSQFFEGWLGVDSQTLALIFMAILAMGMGLVNPIIQGLISKATPANEQGSILGENQSIGSLARVLAPLTAGLLYEVAGWLPFVVGAFLMAQLWFVNLSPKRIRAVVSNEPSSAKANDDGSPDSAGPVSEDVHRN